MIKFTTLAAAVLASASLTAFVCAPAFAQDVAPPSTEIHTSDLNLATANGLKQLDQRIRRAARQVCGGDDGRRDISTQTNVDRCVVIAIKNARIAAEPKVAAATTKGFTTAAR
jgi:UrcA family protein